MTNEGLNLLRRLGAGVIPDGAGSPPARTPIETSGFRTLLVEAGSGEIRTGRPVLVRAALDRALTPAQFQSLADAADLAQAAGAKNVIAIIDDHALVIDVPVRRITGEIPLGRAAQRPGDVLAGIDAAVVAHPTRADRPDGRRDEQTEDNGAAPAPIEAEWLASELTQIQNRSVAELLAGIPEIRRAG